MSIQEIKRTKLKGARFNQAECKALDQIAASQSRTVSETLRELVRSEAERIGVWPGRQENRKQVA